MIDKLIGFSIKHKAIISFLILLLIGWGVYSLFNLPIDAVPDITNNQVQVHSLAPSLAAQEVEQTITSPLEIAMANIPGVIEIRSISRFGLAVITIVFKDEVDIYLARQLVAQKITEAQGLIPAGIARIELAPITTGLGEIYQYVLHTKQGYDTVYSPTDLRTIQDWIVKRQLAGTPGVAEINSFGGYIKQYEVAINPDRLRSMNLTITDIFNALAANNQNTGGAYIEKEHNAYFIRGVGLVKNLDDIGKIVVKNSNGVPVLIRDVAKVQFGSAVRYGAITRNGIGEVVGGVVLMLKGENSVQVINRVKEKIETIQKALPEGVVIEPYLDRSDLIGRAIHTVSRNLIEGGLIVIFVLILLLGNLRAGLVVASVIPLSMLFAVSMMNIFRVSGNLMSLGAIDFGLIVDGAVIIVEAIVLRITQSGSLSENGELSQVQIDEEVFHSATRIRKSAAFGEIIILIVYLPILALVGIEGKMFKPMAMTVSFAIFGALILSLTYVPMMSALFLSRKITSHKRNLSDKIMGTLHKWYEPTIHFALRKKKLVIFSSLALFIAALIVFNFLGGVFIPTLEEGDFAVEIRLAPGSSLSQTIETTLKAGKILRQKFPEVKEVVCRIGVADIPTDPDPIETSMMMILLKDKSEWVTASDREELAEKMKEALSVIPGVNYEFQQPIQLRFNELISGIRQDVAVKIYGEDLDMLTQLGNQAASIISKIEGATDVLPEKVTGMPQITVEYNRDKIAQYGLSIEDVNKVLESAFAGAKAGVVYEEEKRFDLVVRFDEQHRKDLSDVQDIFIPLPNGPLRLDGRIEASSQIPISEVATVELKKGPTQISRDDTKRRIVVGLNVRNRDVQSVVNDIQNSLNKNLKLPPGYYITYGGQFQHLAEAKNRLMIAVPVALALIFALLFFTFNSIKETLLIFTAIPLAAIGGVFALLIRGLPFSISAGVGFIALFGVAVLNGIVMISYFNQLEKEGVKDLYERIIQGTKVRLRPVVMTAAVASLGFLPMAISTSAGAEVQRPLATVVIGGLISSTLLTLVVLPVLYSIFTTGTWKKFLPKRLGGKSVAVLFFVFVFSFTKTNYAQTNQPADIVQQVKINLDEAIKIALQNNPGLASSRYSVEQQNVLGKTAFDFGKTTVTYDKDNTPPNGNYGIGISQSISFPTVYFQQSKLQNQNIALSEKSYEAVKADLIKNVKAAYYQLVYEKEVLRLYTYQDSIYANFSKVAEVRYRTGETSNLEKLTAQAKYQEVLLQRKQAEADLTIFERELQKLLNINKPIELTDTSLEKLQYVPNIWDALQGDTSSAVENNPLVNFYRQKIKVAEAKHSVEVNKLLPDLSFGYSKLTDNSVFNYYGFQVGVSIPIWFFPQQGRIEAASIGEKIAESDYRNYQVLIQSSYQQQLKEYEKWKEQIDYYESIGLRQADEILKTAQLSYGSGDIGYVEFIQSVSQAVSIKTQYLDALINYNRSVINLNYLFGNQ